MRKGEKKIKKERGRKIKEGREKEGINEGKQ